MVYVRTATLTQADGATWTLNDGRTPAGASSDWIVEDVAGWYGGSGVRGESVARLGHGDFVGRGWRETRTLTLHGTIACEDSDERDWQERNLSGMVWSGEFGTLTCDDGNAVLSTVVRLDGAPQIVKLGVTALKFQIPLRATSPFLYGEWRESTIRPKSAGVGLEFDLFSVGGVLTYGDEIDDGAYVWNDGNALSYPQFTVTADAPGGFAVGIGGRRVVYPWPTYQDMPVVIDMAGSVSIGGIDQSHRLGARQWVGVEPSDLGTPFFDLLEGGSGFCTVRHRDTYI